MSKTVEIKVGSLSNVLSYFGSMYPNSAEAMKEHVSNALDEHIKAMHDGTNVSVCKVVFTMRKDKIIIEYPYGMNEEEFLNALQRVASSSKRELKFGQIGRLGVGMFSFFQVGTKCTFYSRKQGTEDTVKVTIKEGDVRAEFEKPKKRECLDEPGIKLVIENLRFNPTRLRGQLGVQRLQNSFSRKFDAYLRNGQLEIYLNYPGTNHQITSAPLDLPRVDKGYETLYIDGDEDKKINLELYYDPSERGQVSIRHMGVVVIDDISSKNLENDILGLDQSIYS
ncbi:MAG: ATP-binding protein, partial [Candidatus Paceibacterota bacterium]